MKKNISKLYVQRSMVVKLNFDIVDIIDIYFSRGGGGGGQTHNVPTAPPPTTP
jgi:hypothetical protein